MVCRARWWRSILATVTLARIPAVDTSPSAAAADWAAAGTPSAVTAAAAAKANVRRAAFGCFVSTRPPDDGSTAPCWVECGEENTERSWVGPKTDSWYRQQPGAVIGQRRALA